MRKGCITFLFNEVETDHFDVSIMVRGTIPGCTQKEILHRLRKAFFSPCCHLEDIGGSICATDTRDTT